MQIEIYMSLDANIDDYEEVDITNESENESENIKLRNVIILI